jgi:hypothetical protein
MQLRGWGLTRAIRIVIILLVLQHLGLGLVHAFLPAPTAGLTLARCAQALTSLDAVVALTMPLDAKGSAIALLAETSARTIPPDPPPLPRRLPRAPPAA